MGGKPKNGVIVGGVVEKRTKTFLDLLVKEGIFESRSQAVGYILNCSASKMLESKLKGKSANKKNDNSPGGASGCQGCF